MTPTLSTAARDLGSPPSGASGRSWIATLASVPEPRWAASAAVLFAIGGVAQLAGAPTAVFWALYLACYATGGWQPARSGLQALREGTLDVDLLMIVAALVAAAIGQVFDGALLIVIFATSGALESFVTRRTADAVRALLELAPEQATRLDVDDGEQVVDTADLEVGTWCWCAPGSGSAPTARSCTAPARSIRPRSPGSRCRCSGSAATRRRRHRERHRRPADRGHPRRTHRRAVGRGAHGAAGRRRRQ